MYIWYAYRLDVMAAEANPDHVRTLAVHCAGKGPHGTCLFDELMVEIMVHFSPNGGQTYGGAVGVGDNLRPDVITTAQKIMDERLGPLDDPDPALLYQRFQDHYRPNFKQVYTQLTRTITDAYASLKSPDEFKEVFEYERAMEAMRITHAGRLEDQEPRIILHVDYYTQQEKGWTTIKKNVDSVRGGATYEAIDWEETIQAHPEEEDFILQCKAWITDEGPEGYAATDQAYTGDRTYSAQRHMRAIQSSSMFFSKLARTYGSC